MEFDNRKKISVFEDISDRKLKVSDKIIRPIWYGPGCLAEHYAYKNANQETIEDMPYSGDKFACMSPQLGTIGQVMKKDMPYPDDEVPDLVVNTQ